MYNILFEHMFYMLLDTYLVAESCWAICNSICNVLRNHQIIFHSSYVLLPAIYILNIHAGVCYFHVLYLVKSLMTDVFI